MKRLPDVAEYFIGLTYKPTDVGAVGTIVLRSSNVQDDALDLSDLVRVKCLVKQPLYVRKGDILMCSRNGSKRLVGKAALIGDLSEVMTFGTFMTVIRSSHNPYLSWFFRSAAFRDQIGVGENTMINQITKYMLDAIRVPIPSPAEQQRIVTLLDEAFDGIATAKAHAEKNLQNAHDLFDIALSNELNQHRAAEPIVQLGRVCGFENGDRGKNYPGKQHRVASGIPFINAGHLTDDGLDFTDMDYISQERFDLLGNGKIKPNDILFCLRGSLGKFANIGNLSQGAIASSLVILRPSERLLKEYLMFYLGSRMCAEMITRFKGGAAQPNLGAKDLKSFEIPVPPLALQQDTVFRLSDLKNEIRSLTEIYTRKTIALDDLKKSLLHRAFNGDL